MYVNPAYGHTDAGESRTDPDDTYAPWLDTKDAVLVKRRKSGRREWLRDAGIVLALVLAGAALVVIATRGCKCQCDCCTKPADGETSYATHAQVEALNQTLAAFTDRDDRRYATPAEVVALNDTVMTETLKVAQRIASAEAGAQRLCDALYESKAITMSLEVVQEIETSGAYDWEYFVMNSTTYLAVANSYNDTSYSISSRIYSHSAMTNQFEVMQEIDTCGARDWEAFTLNGATYLAVANYQNKTTTNIKSRIYRYSAITSRFKVVQEVDTNGARGWEAFTLNGTTCLAVANFYNGRTYNVTSRIYRYSAVSELFEVMQEVDTSGALDWEAFTINGETFLAVANSRDGDGNTFNVKSCIYRYSTVSNQFEVVQEVETSGAVDWKAFMLDSVVYLAVANAYNGTTHNIKSRIYRHSAISDQFEALQEVASSGAYDWEAFTLNGAAYLAVTNYKDDSNFNLISRVYRYSATTERFELVQEVNTNGALDWQAFTLGGASYLAVAHWKDDSGTYNIESRIYRLRAPC